MKALLGGLASWLAGLLMILAVAVLALFAAGIVAHAAWWIVRLGWNYPPPDPPPACVRHDPGGWLPPPGEDFCQVPGD